MRFALALVLLLAAGPAVAQQWVNGYYRSDGTYVQPYYRSSPNGTTLDNYSTKGNVNSYTGQAGTKNPYGNSYGNTYGGGYSGYGTSGSKPCSLVYGCQ